VMRGRGGRAVRAHVGAGNDVGWGQRHAGQRRCLHGPTCTRRRARSGAGDAYTRGGERGAIAVASHQTRSQCGLGGLRLVGRDIDVGRGCLGGGSACSGGHRGGSGRSSADAISGQSGGLRPACGSALLGRQARWRRAGGKLVSHGRAVYSECAGGARPACGSRPDWEIARTLGLSSRCGNAELLTASSIVRRGGASSRRTRMAVSVGTETKRPALLSIQRSRILDCIDL